jgi:hypothetical protein
VTADLLSVWTDTDTAMHAVGASLGIFPDRVPDTRRIEGSGPPLRNALYDVLLTLVDEGALEKRACSDGRFAFRWRDTGESAAVSTGATSARLDAWLDSMPRQVRWSLAPAPAAASAPGPYWPRLVASVAPLLLPALSCLLALVAFVVFGPAVGLAVLGVLALAGIIGLVRRVPIAGFWTSGLVVAAVLMRFS